MSSDSLLSAPCEHWTCYYYYHIFFAFVHLERDIISFFFLLFEKSLFINFVFFIENGYFANLPTPPNLLGTYYYFVRIIGYYSLFVRVIILGSEYFFYIFYRIKYRWPTIIFNNVYVPCIRYVLFYLNYY